MLFKLTLHISWTNQFSLLWKHSIHYMLHWNCKCFFASLWPAKCCTYAVPVNIAQLFKKPFLNSQTFTTWSYFFWGGAGFFKTFMLTLYTSLKVQLFLPKRYPPKRCTYAVPVNIAHLLNFFICYTNNQITICLTESANVFFANLWPSEMLHLCC